MLIRPAAWRGTFTEKRPGLFRSRRHRLLEASAFPSRPLAAAELASNRSHRFRFRGCGGGKLDERAARRIFWPRRTNTWNHSLRPRFVLTMTLVTARSTPSRRPTAPDGKRPMFGEPSPSSGERSTALSPANKCNRQSPFGVRGWRSGRRTPIHRARFVLTAIAPGSAGPSNRLRHSSGIQGGGAKMERVKGIEPSYSAWKAAALPLSYTRSGDVGASPPL